MLGLNLGWSLGETIFAIGAMLAMGLGVFGVDRLFFRRRQKPAAPLPLRKHRVSYVIEEIPEDDAEEKKPKD
jgi:hypothetical protein